MSGDVYKRREVSPGVYQCGCRWVREKGWGDVLRECALHAAATKAKVAKFEKKQKK